MIKTLKTVFQRDKEKFIIPKAVQDTIPVQTVYADGIFKVGSNKYSKTFKFADINYSVSSDEDKKTIFLAYEELLNSFDSAATTKITVNNRKLNKEEFEKEILLENQDDGLDYLRKEYNEMLRTKVTASNALIQEKYITVSINKKSVDDARTYFNRVGSELSSRFARLGSVCAPVELDERLKIIHDFYMPDDELPFRFDLKEAMQKGHDFKDTICPDSMECEKGYFRIGDKYARVLFLRDYASYIKDDFLANLTALNKNLMVSIDVIPVPTNEAVKEAETRLLGVETNITNWQRKQNANNNFSATIPYDMEQQKKEMKEFLDDITTRDQRMMFGVITIVHMADSKKQLDEDTEEICNIANSSMCKMTVFKLREQMYDALKTVLPYGVRKIDTMRTLTTESLAVFIPFNVQNIYHKKGIYYGVNPRNRNLIIADRFLLLNGNSFILGVSGGGKSFTAKMEIICRALSDTNADIIIIDPEREDKNITKVLNGQHIVISANSQNHINAMDLNRYYGEGADPLVDKTQFIMSLCEQIMGSNAITPQHKSIVDRCTYNVYREYIRGNYEGEPPTLVDLYEELLKQPEQEAEQLALALELFAKGSLNTFSKQTNIDPNNRLICYDIFELGKQLMPIGMLVILDSILNRITANREKGRRTYIFIDEIYLMFAYEYSAEFLYRLWKRARKYGACVTGITQNVEDILQSHTARTMLSNSEFVVMLNQAATDRTELARLLNISDAELDYITNAEAGHGLIKIGSSLVPFENDFPKNTQLYKLMSTKPGEDEGMAV